MKIFYVIGFSYWWTTGGGSLTEPCSYCSWWWFLQVCNKCSIWSDGWTAIRFTWARISTTYWNIDTNTTKLAWDQKIDNICEAFLHMNAFPKMSTFYCLLIMSAMESFGQNVQNFLIDYYPCLSICFSGFLMSKCFT